MKKYRVIIWGHGMVGQAAIRMIQEKKSLELVGVIDVDPNKIGKDAGEVYGFAKTGVTVSGDVEKVLAQEADVVLAYLPVRRTETGLFTPSAQDMCVALNAKKNVVTTLPLFFSQEVEPETYKMLDECAKANGVTFMPTGLLPGHYASYVPMVICGMVGHVDSILVESGEDDSTNAAPWVKVFGYGTDPAAFPHDRLAYNISHYYIGAVYEMGARLGFKFDDVRVEHSHCTAPKDLRSPLWGEIKKGTISAHIFEMSGVVKGKKVVTMRYVHKICHDQNPEPNIQDQIVIKGVPNLVAEIKGMMPEGELFMTSAAPTVNLVPACAEAAPGYRLAMDNKVVVPLL